MEVHANAVKAAEIVSALMNSYATAAIISSLDGLHKGISAFMKDSGEKIISSFKGGVVKQDVAGR